MTNKPSLMSTLKKNLDSSNVSKKEGTHTESLISKEVKSNFIRMTITMPPALLLQLKNYGAEQRASGKKHCDTSSLIRKAVQDYLNKNT